MKVKFHDIFVKIYKYSGKVIGNTVMDENILKNFFGDLTGISNWLYKEIVDEINKNKYKYAYLSWESIEYKLKVNDIAFVNSYMTFEILQRLYLSTLTGYLRQCKWIDGICQGIKVDNYILFSSSARGFLEASSDFYDALEDIPLSLAENYKLLCKAIEGKVDYEIIDFHEIEDRLLHFQEANRQNGKNDSKLKPKSAKLYMESRNIKQLDLYECYSELCEVTHPAKQSLDWFFEENNYILTINLNRDKECIDKFVNKYTKKYTELLMRTENLCIIIFKMINLFKIKGIYLPFIEKVDISSLRIWNKIKKYIQ